jgi:hypothetical protein
MVCRFVGELNMNITIESAVKAKNRHSICEPDWGNRMSIGSIEEANCCIEYNDRLGFVVRMVRDIEADENFVLYDEVCKAMYIDEHVESKRGWLAGEKTMTEMDNATLIDLEELANKEKFMDLHMVLERPRYLTRGLELTLFIYNQLVSIYRRDAMAARTIKKAHVEAIDCVVNMFHVEYNRIVIETQEVMANKVKEFIQYEQQYDDTVDDTVVEQVMDVILGDAPEMNLIKESNW